MTAWPGIEQRWQSWCASSCAGCPRAETAAHQATQAPPTEALQGLLVTLHRHGIRQ